MNYVGKSYFYGGLLSCGIFGGPLGSNYMSWESGCHDKVPILIDQSHREGFDGFAANLMSMSLL